MIDICFRSITVMTIFSSPVPVYLISICFLYDVNPIEWQTVYYYTICVSKFPLFLRILFIREEIPIKLTKTVFLEIVQPRIPEKSKFSFNIHEF